MNYKVEQLIIDDNKQIHTPSFEGKLFALKVPQLSSIIGSIMVPGEYYPRIIIETSPSEKTREIIIGLLKMGQATSINPQLRRLLNIYNVKYHHTVENHIYSIFEILDLQMTKE